MNRNAFGTWAPLYLAALVGLVLPPVGRAAVTPHTIVAAGLPAPGFAEGVTHAFRYGTTPSVTSMALGHGGHVLFSADVAGPGIELDGDDIVLWQRDPDGTLSLVSRSSSDAPGLGAGFPVYSLRATSVAATGASAFRAELGPVGTGLVTADNDLAAYRRAPDGTLELLAQEGQPLPSRPELALGYDQGASAALFPYLNRSGLARFWHTLRGGSEEWFAQFGPVPGHDLGVVLQYGSYVPGYDAEREYVWLNTTVMNDAGAFAGHANWRTTGTSGNGSSAVVGPGIHGALSLLASQNDVVPGYVAPAQWLAFLDSHNVGLTANGAVFFTGEFYDNDLVRRYALVRSAEGFTELLLKQWDPAPGFEGLGYQLGPFGSMAVNASGSVLLHATVYTAFDEWGYPTDDIKVLYVRTPGGEVTPIAWGGLPAPGFEAEAAPFESFANFTIALNGAGQVYFAGAVLPVGGVTSANDGAVWLYTPGFGVELVLREGQGLEVAPADVRTVRGWGTSTVAYANSGGSDSRTMHLNDRGEIALQVSFIEASGDPQYSNAGLFLFQHTEDDGDACTEWGCIPGVGCGQQPISCDDGDPCNGDETCEPLAGCQPGVPLACDDLNPCTDDACDPALLCLHANNAFSRPCYTGPAGTLDVGDCVAGIEACAEGAFGACEGQVVPDVEACDGQDNDCDGPTDEELPDVPSTCGVGACASTGVVTCFHGRLLDTCRPGEASAEICDAIDNDCDGRTDAADPYDLVAHDPRPCEKQAGVCATATKTAAFCKNGAWRPCNDSIYRYWNAAYANPEPAGCDGLDQDCNGQVDEAFVPSPTPAVCGVGECSHTGATSCVGGEVNDACVPGAAADEVCNNLDDDCDGVTDDAIAPLPASCGTGACLAVGTRTCSAGEWTVSCTPLAGAPSDPTCDAVDDDCDGLTDEDVAPQAAAGTCGTGGCRRSAQVVCQGGSMVIACVPGVPQPETCNGVDDDCDGKTDAADPVDLVKNDKRPCEKQAGVCATATKTAAFCKNGKWLACNDAIYRYWAPTYTVPEPAGCDGKDQDCDGQVDEGFVSTPTAQVCGLGLCARWGYTTCVDGSILPACTPGPTAPESCNLADDDCDGVTDNATPEPITCGEGACRADGLRTCQAGWWIDDCTPGTAPLGDATCDAVDDDCDGQADEDATPLPAPDACGVGACRKTATAACVGGTRVCTPGAPTPEVCNLQDDDCDGRTDAADPVDLVANDRRPCEKQAGVCSTSSKTAAFCKNGKWLACNDSIYRYWAAAYASTEPAGCDAADNDCDGLVDEGVSGACTASNPFGTCTGARYCDGLQPSCSAPQPAPEDCVDGQDNDCDALPDCVDDDCTEMPACGPGWLTCGDTIVGTTLGGPQAPPVVPCSATEFAGPMKELVFHPTVDGQATLTLTDATVDLDIIVPSQEGCVHGDTSATFPVLAGRTVPVMIVGVAPAGGDFHLAATCAGVENCADGTDNDADGQADCLDPDCAAESHCLPVEICDNRIDDDGDGVTDCSDADCYEAPACQSMPEDCYNGLDDDADGLSDCDDADCAAEPWCQPMPEDCVNGQDDDGDGDVDCADPDCAAEPSCALPEQCTNSVDDDADGLVDCQDPDCALGCGLCSQDAWEPDDKPETASTLVSFVPKQSTICPANDFDAGVFTLTEPANVSLQITNPQGDLTLWLGDAQLSNLAQAEGTAAAPASLAVAALPAGTYYVAVWETGNNQTVSDYFLLLHVGNGLTETACGNAEDDDADLLTDCADPDCAGVGPCL